MSKAVAAKPSSRKSQILEAAALLFRQKGFQSSTMRQLAEQMKMEAASLYNHIKAKDELLHNICFGVADDFVQNLQQVESSPISPLEKLEKLIRFHISILIKKYEAVYVANRDWKHLQEPALGRFQQQRREYEKRFAAIIEEGIAQGQLYTPSPQMAVLTILSAVRSIESWQRGKKTDDAHIAEETIVLLLLKGLTNKP